MDLGFNPSAFPELPELSTDGGVTPILDTANTFPSTFPDSNTAIDFSNPGFTPTPIFDPSPVFDPVPVVGDPNAGFNPLPVVGDPNAGFTPTPIFDPNPVFDPVPVVGDPNAGFDPVPVVDDPNAGFNPVPIVDDPNAGTLPTVSEIEAAIGITPTQESAFFNEVSDLVGDTTKDLSDLETIGNTGDPSDADELGIVEVGFNPFQDAFSDDDGRIQGGVETLQNALENGWFSTALEIAGGFLPGVGEIQDAAGLIQALQNQDPSGATLAGLSILLGIFDPTPAGQAALKAIFRNSDDAAGLLTRLGGALNNMSPSARTNLGNAIQNLDEVGQSTIGKQALELASGGVDGNVLNDILSTHADPGTALTVLQNSVKRMTDGGLSTQQITDLTRNLGPELAADLSQSFLGRMGNLGVFSDALKSLPARTRGELVQGLSNADSATRTLAADLINAGLRPTSIKDALVHTANPQSTLQMISDLASATSPTAVNNLMRQVGISNTMTISQALSQNGVNPTAQTFGDELFQRFGARVDNLPNSSAQVEVTAARDLAQRELTSGGHSIQRHSPDLTDAELQGRLTQGIVPGETRTVNRPAQRSTRFHSYAQQNQLQQRSLEEAMQHLGIPSINTPPSALGLSGDQVPQVTINWGQSVGTGFEGVDPQLSTTSYGARVRRYQSTQPIDPNQINSTTIGLTWDGNQWQINQFSPGVAGTGPNAINRTP